MKKLRSNECGEKGKLKTCEVRLRTKEGQIVPISLNASIIFNKDREVATIGFFHDLREDLKIKSELEKDVKKDLPGTTPTGAQPLLSSPL